MDIIQIFRNHFQQIEPEALREMSMARLFKEVVEAYERGQAGRKSPVFDTVGYCYYQLANYEKAILNLRKAVEVYESDYYSRFFLAVCLKLTGQVEEGIQHMLLCLKTRPQNAQEVLDQLFPWIISLSDSKKSEGYFREIQSLIATLNLSQSQAAKLLFYQKREGEMTPEMLQEFKVCTFHSGEELSEMGLCQYTGLGPSEKLRYVPIVNDQESWVDTNCVPYLAEIPNAKIVSGSSLIFINNERVLSEVLAHKKYGQYVETSFDLTIAARRPDKLLVNSYVPSEDLAEGFMLCGYASNAYGHWFAEFLPKVRFFEKHPRYSQIPIIIDEGMPPSHYEYLKILSNNPVYILKKGVTLKVKNLIVAPTDTFFPTDLVKNHKVPVEDQSSVTVGALKFIQEKIIARYGAPVIQEGARYFLSRRNSQWRRMTNESEVIEVVEKLGFKTIFVEDLNLEQQIRLFQEAEFIVAPNGSATSNLIFSNPRIKIILIGQKHVFNWGTWFGSFMELGYSLHYLAGDSLLNENEKHIDYAVSPSIVRNKISEMLGL